MELKFTKIVDNGVTGIVTALKPHHEIRILGEEIDHPAFTLVAPVGAYHDLYTHKHLDEPCRVHIPTSRPDTPFLHRGDMRSIASASGGQIKRAGRCENDTPLLEDC
jgi:hypothetical protein